VEWTWYGLHSTWATTGHGVSPCTLASGHINQRVPLMLAAKSKRSFYFLLLSTGYNFLLAFSPQNRVSFIKEDRKKKG